MAGVESRLYRPIVAAGNFDESKHPRHEKGKTEGGRFAPAHGGSSTPSVARDERTVDTAGYDQAVQKTADDLAEMMDTRSVEYLNTDKPTDQETSDAYFEALKSMDEDGSYQSTLEESAAAAGIDITAEDTYQPDSAYSRYEQDVHARLADKAPVFKDVLGGGVDLQPVVDMTDKELSDYSGKIPSSDLQTRKMVQNVMDTRMKATLREAGVTGNKGLIDLEDSQLEALDKKLSDNPDSDPQLVKLVKNVLEGRKGTQASALEDELEGLTAAAAGMVPVHPPAEWFDDPKLEGPTPLEVTADGRVSGHLAAFGTCHIANPRGQGVCVEPPTSNTDYGYFHLGQVEAEDGRRVHVGQITMDSPHAPVGATARTASAHYDHTGTAAADVRVGEDEHGIWVAGALRPSLTATAARTLMGAKLSGDWRGVKGNLELVGILAVNVPGFPVPRPKVLMADAAPVADEWPEVRETLLAAGIVCDAPVDEKAVKRRTKVMAARAVGGTKGMASLAAGAKVEKVMKEYKTGRLHSGSKTGPKVTSREQAIAIALSEEEDAKKKEVTAAAFDPSKHPREPGGKPGGGRWARVTYNATGEVTYVEGLPSATARNLQQQGLTVGGKSEDVTVAPIEHPPEEDIRVRGGGAAKVGDTVVVQRHGLEYDGKVMGVGPKNARVQYTTNNGQTKTISIPHAEYKVKADRFAPRSSEEAFAKSVPLATDSPTRPGQVVKPGRRMSGEGADLAVTADNGVSISYDHNTGEYVAKDACGQKLRRRLIGDEITAQQELINERGKRGIKGRTWKVIDPNLTRPDQVG